MSIFGPNCNIAINIAHLWMFASLYCYKVCFTKVDVALDEGMERGGLGVISQTQSNPASLSCDELVVELELCL